MVNFGHFMPPITLSHLLPFPLKPYKLLWISCLYKLFSRNHYRNTLLISHILRFMGVTFLFFRDDECVLTSATV